MKLLIDRRKPEMKSFKFVPTKLMGISVDVADFPVKLKKQITKILEYSLIKKFGMKNITRLSAVVEIVELEEWDKEVDKGGIKL